MRVPAALTLCILLLAGCSGPDAAEDQAQKEGPVKVEGQKDRSPTNKQEDATTGDLVGRVHDVRNQSVAEAHVALLGSELVAITDPDGRFNLTAPAGRHALRITAADFRAIENDVVLAAGEVVEVSIRLEYSDGRLGERLAHSHNYWGGQDTYLLMDEEVEVHRGHPVFWEVMYANDGSKGRYEIPLPEGTPSEPPIVLPGTARIEVTLSWDSLEIPADHIGLSYLSADSSDRVDMDAKPSGGLHAIDVTPEMTDSGHQVWSFWRFWVWLDNDATAATDWEPTVINGPIHVKIELHKGDEMPAEPGHRDFWGGNDSLVLMTMEDVHGWGAVCCNQKDLMAGFTLPDGVLVPPGTARLEFRFTWWYTDSSPVLNKEFAVLWRSGDQNPSQTKYDDLHAAEPVEEDESLKVYEIDLESHQTDQYYQKKTNWFWVPYPVGEEPLPYAIEKSARRFAMDVTAYR